MRATLDKDIIVKIGGPLEIGQLPKGVGLERLRFDGKKIIDLATLDEIWVEEKNGVFILHAVEVPGSQLVKMKYAERKRLINDNGKIRLKTDEEIEAEKKAEERRAALGNLEVQVEDLRRLLFALVHGADLSAFIPAPKTEQIQEVREKLERLSSQTADR